MMDDALIHTPLTLDVLDNDHARFVGSAEETKTTQIPFAGEVEIKGKYPLLLLQRDVWEALGKPTELMLDLGQMPARHEAG